MQSWHAHSEVLAAAVDLIVPPDELVGGWQGGVRDYLDARWDSDLRWAHAPVLEILASLAGTALLGGDEAARVAALEEAWLRHPAGYAALVRLCREGYYAGLPGHPPAGWDLVGYRPWPFPTPPAELDLAPPTIALGDLAARYDVIVIGSGPGGGVTARVLAEAGASVLLVERAAMIPNSALHGDHLHGKRLSIYDTTAGPGAGNPRVVEELDGSTWTADADGSGDEWGLNAMVVGGGTRVWQGMAWRVFPEDFTMAQTYGVPDGSSLTDWPFGYDDLAPSYDWAERELGVSGATGDLTDRMPRHPGYAMPALADDDVRAVLGAAAQSRGWGHGAIPFAINSIERDGRPACVRCNQCMGHTCPIGAKNGSHNSFVEPAIATGRCDLLVSAQAVRIVHEAGHATGVELVVGSGAERERLTVSADRVVVAAGAIETPRLLLASGLGNDHVGRHLHGHAVTLYLGLTDPDAVPTFGGPGHSVATMEFLHDGRGTIGGGVIFDAFKPYPLMLASWADLFLGTEASPLEHKRWMRTAGRGGVLGTMTMCYEISHPESRVMLEPGLRDAQGMPAVRIRRAIHPATIEARAALGAHSRDWLEAAGCTDIVDVFTPRPGAHYRRSPATEHSAGTVRMGLTPESSAAGADGLLWGATNVYVNDASLLPTTGGVNPTLTIIANAHRIAKLLAG